MSYIPFLPLVRNSLGWLTFFDFIYPTGTMLMYACMYSSQDIQRIVWRTIIGAILL